MLYGYIGIGIITCEENNLKPEIVNQPLKYPHIFIMLMYYEFISVYLKVFLVC
jgi:hypothetical protein